MNEEGERVLRQLFTFAAKKLGREFSSYCSRAWARVSCCLQRSIAQVILSRVDGVTEGSELPDESFGVVSSRPSVGEWPVGEFSIGEPVGVEQKREPLVSEPPKAGARQLVVSQRPAASESKSGVQKLGASQEGERAREIAKERREGGGGIMNITHKSTIRTSSQMSCKKTIGREGPGRINASNAAGSRDSYVPSTTPPPSKGSHTNRRSNTVTPRNKHHTAPSRSTGGHPLLVGTPVIAVSNAVLPRLEFGSRSGRSASRNTCSRTPNLARGSSAAREKSVDLL